MKEEELVSLWIETDANRDGFITKDEFIQFMIDKWLLKQSIKANTIIEIFWMYRSINSPLISPFEQAEATHKDVVIASLKKELHELRDLETDFVRLNDEIMALESKYALLLDEKDRNEKEHRYYGQWFRTKMDINKKTILDMRADVDSLKVQIHKASVEIEDTIRENTTLKRMCDNRATEISALMAGNRELEKDNEHRTEENKQLTYNV